MNIMAYLIKNSSQEAEPLGEERAVQHQARSFVSLVRGATAT